MPLVSGTKLGPYEVVGPLGAGGMGEVYRARDTRLERTVAIKILPEQLSHDPVRKQRFEREAKTISNLNHPHICVLHDIGSQNGVEYLVMECVEGETLAKRLEKGALPLEQVLKFGAQIADALDKAHRSGVVHRDLKPGNIMLTPTGAKLLDFGLAKPFAPILTGATLTAATQPSPVTAEGTVVGTFQYMSPEQIEGKELDGRSDIFSLGAVLYEMLTGQRAFQGKTQLSVASAILEKEPEPIRSLKPLTPPSLHHAIHSCLAKDPEERWQTARDLVLELKWTAEGGAQVGMFGPAPQGKVGREWFAWSIAAVLGVTAALNALLYLDSKRSLAEPVLHAALLPPERVSVTGSEGVPVSPDGTKLAFIGVDDNGNSLLYVQPLNTSHAQALSGTQGAEFPFWSPNSQAIGFFADGELKRIAASGGSATVLAEAPGSPAGGAWSANGVIIYATGATNLIMRVPAGGGTPSRASKLAAADASTWGEVLHQWPSFLPDGKHFLFSALPNRTVCIGELGSLDHRVLLSNASGGSYAEGYLLFVRQRSLLAQPFSLSKLSASGDALPVVENLALSQARAYSSSNNGLMVYQGGQLGTKWPLTWYSRDGKPLGNVGPLANFQGPVISPDGMRVAVNIRSGEQTDVWVFDLAHGTQTRLTFDGNSRHPFWSADGKRIFYFGTVPPTNHDVLLSKPTDNSGPPETVIADIGPAVWGSISADGRYLAYMRDSDQPGWGFDIWGIDFQSDRKPFPVVRSPFMEITPWLSPDGKWVAYISNETGRYEVYITAFPSGGTKWQVSTEGGLTPRWRGDGKELFFSIGSDRIMAVDVATTANSVTLGTPYLLFQANMQSSSSGSYTVTPDGKKFLVNSLNAQGGSNPLTLVTNWTAELKK